MRVVIVDDMLGGQGDGDELVNECDRCGAAVDDDTVTEVSVFFWGIGSAEWFWCEECADSFTAWRLTPSAPSATAPAGDEVPF